MIHIAAPKANAAVAVPITVAPIAHRMPSWGFDPMPAAKLPRPCAVLSWPPGTVAYWPDA